MPSTIPCLSLCLTRRALASFVLLHRSRNINYDLPYYSSTLPMINRVLFTTTVEGLILHSLPLGIRTPVQDNALKLGFKFESDRDFMTLCPGTTFPCQNLQKR